MDLPGFLVQDADGYIHLAEHRIGLHHVARLFNDGYIPEMIVGHFPTLSLPLVYKVIAFYLENQTEVDAYISRCDAELAELAASAKRGPDMAELRRRLERAQYADAS